MKDEQERLRHEQQQLEVRIAETAKKEQVLHDIIQELQPAPAKLESMIDASFKVSYGLRINEDIDRMKVLIDALKIQLDATGDGLFGVHLEIRAKLEHLERERDELAQRLHGALASVKSTEETRVFTVTKLEATIGGLQNELQTERNSSSKEKDRLRKNLHDTDVELKSLQSAHVALQLKLDATVNEMRRIIEEKDREKRALEDRLMDKEKYVESKTTEFMSSVTVMQREFGEGRQAQENNERELRRLLADMQQQRDSVQDKLSKLELTMQKRELELNSAISQLKDRLERTTLESRDWESKYMKLSVEFKDKVSILEKTIATLNDEKQSLLKRVKDLENTVAELQRKITMLEERNMQQQRVVQLLSHEIDRFTDSHSMSRLTRHDKMKITVQQMELLLNKYLEIQSNGNGLTVGDYVQFMVQQDVMLGVQLQEVVQLFNGATRAFIGWIEVLSSYKDLYTLSKSFDVSLSKKASGLSRLELKTVFENSGLSYYKQEYLTSFNAIVLHCDKSGDEFIDKPEFMKVALMLIVFRLLFVEADTERNGTLSLAETTTMLKSYKVEAKFVSKVETMFGDYVVGGNGDNLSYEGFTGCILSNIPRKFNS